MTPNGALPTRGLPTATAALRVRARPDQLDGATSAWSCNPHEGCGVSRCDRPLTRSHERRRCGGAAAVLADAGVLQSAASITRRRGDRHRCRRLCRRSTDLLGPTLAVSAEAAPAGRAARNDPRPGCWAVSVGFEQRRRVRVSDQRRAESRRLEHGEPRRRADDSELFEPARRGPIVCVTTSSDGIVAHLEWWRPAARRMSRFMPRSRQSAGR